jgi:hypothetical protein
MSAAGQPPEVALPEAETEAIILPLLKNEWVEMGDPAPPHRRTHGGTGAGRRPLSSPWRRRQWPAGQALQGPSVPGYDRHRRTDGLQFKTMRSRQASCRALHHPFEIQESHYSQVARSSGRRRRLPSRCCGLSQGSAVRRPSARLPLLQGVSAARRERRRVRRARQQRALRARRLYGARRRGHRGRRAGAAPSPAALQATAAE